jgi:hypothetical protein
MGFDQNDLFILKLMGRFFCIAQVRIAPHTNFDMLLAWLPAGGFSKGAKSAMRWWPGGLKEATYAPHAA